MSSRVLKGAWLVHRADNLAIFICQLSRNSVILNPAEPQGPVQACVGLAFSLLLPLFYKSLTKAWLWVLMACWGRGGLQC